MADRKSDSGLDVVRAGFIALADAAPLIVAAEKGFAAARGIALKLTREASWANIRDRMEYGAFDCAHMLAPMPLANALGLTPASLPILVPMVLNLGGSAITVSTRVFEEMQALAPDDAAAGGNRAARAFARVVRRRQAAAAAPLMLGMVYPFSSHNYDLRCWLASAGLDPDEDVSLVVIPPPLLADSLAAGRIDGFCVGSPWSSVAVQAGAGAIIATKSELCPRAPEKVLGVRADFAERKPDVLARLIQALVHAAQWLDAPENRPEAADLLATSAHLGVPADLIVRALEGRLDRAPLTARKPDPDFLVFARHDASFPWPSHAVWLMAQMIRWGQVRRPFSLRDVAATVYRPDLYRAAVKPLGLATPQDNFRIEGPPTDALDPSRPLDYLTGLGIRTGALDLEGFAASNG